jgi:NAD(P)-dependent dehydrogenase (short-subunit alcohol dehydrogenase family)
MPLVLPGRCGLCCKQGRPDGFTQALAAEFGPQGLRVNAILPGAVDTPMFRGMSNTNESVSFMKGLHALKRVAAPQELAKSASYLASDFASFQTGTAMLVDGGLSINRT